MVASPQQWRTYEEVATKILDRLRDALGLSAVEGKQSLPGLSGTEWELDAKGIKQESDAFVIVECRRQTTSRIKQEAVAALAFRIQDTGAAGGFVVSPLGFQEGAQKVARSANIHSVLLNAAATPQEFVLSFLGNLFLSLTGVKASAEAGKVIPVIEVGLTGVESHCAAGTVGSVAEERYASGERFRIRTRTPEGARSREMLADGVVSLEIHGPTQTGLKGEPRALDTLLSRLRQEGHHPALEKGRDGHGEDGILRLGGDRLTLQVTVVPRCCELWRNANRDSAMASVPVADAAKWLRDAVLDKATKTPPSERATTILVLDAALAGVLSAPEVGHTYLALYGDPQVEFGFAAVWLVGPTPSTTTRLGTGGV